MEDAMKIGCVRAPALVGNVLKQSRQQTITAPQEWRNILNGDPALRVRLSPAGHILGSAYVEFDLVRGGGRQRIVFSGDLGTPYTSLLPAPRPPYGADLLVLHLW